MKSPRRLALLIDHNADCLSAKTAAGMLRYCPNDVACLLAVGGCQSNSNMTLGVRHNIPTVFSVQEALQTNPSGLLISMAPAGGKLTPSWYNAIKAFIVAGLDVISGMHQFLGDDKELASLSLKTGSRLVDLRRPPQNVSVGCGNALSHQGLRVLTIGTDECCGKMTAALELTAAAETAGWRPRFLATGQTGLAIAGFGVAIDAVTADFIAGAAENLVLDSTSYGILFIEGQGALTSPCFSGVTLGLMHGCMPQVLILCHDAGRHLMRGLEFSIPALRYVVDLHESVMTPFVAAKVAALCVNTSQLKSAVAMDLIGRYERDLGIPVTDPVRFGVSPILAALDSVHASYVSRCPAFCER